MANDINNGDDRINITIRVADVKPIALSVRRQDEPQYRESEQLVNKLWKTYSLRFRDTSSPEEVLARVAYQFARLYAQAYRDNQDTHKFLAEFEQKLDEIVINV